MLSRCEYNVHNGIYQNDHTVIIVIIIVIIVMCVREIRQSYDKLITIMFNTYGVGVNPKISSYFLIIM